ncbi:unnamed protein product [Trifolium pratense]|uniref:Uncharacterized protein n=1 Tax=Trifolium pratense TaxID=57577 RepID=A0ACB0KTR1_TRIPR|nr:unnamed protein product [Trifolium pratense]
MAAAAKQSLKKTGMHVPPWRKRDYMLAKWISPSAARSKQVSDAAVQETMSSEVVVDADYQVQPLLVLVHQDKKVENSMNLKPFSNNGFSCFLCLCSSLDFFLVLCFFAFVFSWFGRSGVD